MTCGNETVCPVCEEPIPGVAVDTENMNSRLEHWSKDELKEMQLNDDDLKQVLTWKLERSEKPHKSILQWSSSEVRPLCNQ